MKFEYIEGSIDQLDTIKPLWEKQRLHHERVSTYFKHFFEKVDWSKRVKVFLEKSKNGLFKTIIIKDMETNSIIGYIIATINKDLIGEIDSIFIKDKYRGQKLGESLMTKVLSWMDENLVKRKTLFIAVGNERVDKFYKKFGFYPRLLQYDSIDE